MLSKEIFDALGQIADAKGKNEKRDLLKTFMQDADFQRVMNATYNPFIKYQLGSAVLGRTEPGVVVSGRIKPGIDDKTWDMLNRLAVGGLSGYAAQTEVREEFNRLDPKSAKLLWRILKKDARAGFSEESLNKAVPGFVATFPYMRCSSVKDIKLDKLPWNEGIFVQKKADGMFTNVDLADPNPAESFAPVVSLRSRQGRELPIEQFSELVSELQTYFKPGFQLHGELLVERNGIVLPREQSNGILNHVANDEPFPEGHRPIYEAWDMIPLAEVRPKGKCAVPYSMRFRMLSDAVPPPGTGSPLRLIPSQRVKSAAEMMEVYRKYLAAGEEGAVGKNPRGTWKDGTSRDQWKLKDEQVVSLRLRGFRDGEGKNAATFGALICRTEDDLLEVGVSGISDKLRQEISDKRDQLLDTAIIDVKANGIMKPQKAGDLYSLFLPRFVEIRTDKSKADTLYEVQQQFDSAVK